MKKQFITLLASILFAYSALAAYQRPCTPSEITRAARLKTILDTSIGGSLSCFLGYQASRLIQPQFTGLSHDNAVGLAILGGIGIGALTFIVFRELCMMAYTRAGYSEHDRAKIRMKNNKEEAKILIEALASGAILFACAAMKSAAGAIHIHPSTAFKSDEKQQAGKAVAESKTVETVPMVDAIDVCGSEHFICNE